MDLNTAIQNVKDDVAKKPRNFNVSFDLSIVLRLKKKNAKSLGAVRGAILLPHAPNRTKKKKIAIIAKAGSVPDFVYADKIGDEDLINEVKSGKILYDRYFALADNIKNISSLARVLGPKGLMPNAKNGSIISSEDSWKNVEHFRSSRMVEARSDKNGVINMSVGCVADDKVNLRDNIMEVIAYVNSNAGESNLEMRKVCVNSTMGGSFVFNI